MERQITTYADFRGGMNVDVSPLLIGDNELLLARNVDLGERGALRTRAGVAVYNSSAYGASVTQIFEWPKKNGDVWLMAVLGKTLKRIVSDSSTTTIQAVNLDTVGYVPFNDKLYFVDGNAFYEVSGSSASAVSPYNDVTNDLTPVKRCTMLIRHPKSMRFFAAGDPQNVSALYYSEPNQPDFWKETSVLHPTEGDGAVKAIALLADAVLVFFSRSIWVWRGIDPDEDVIWEKLSAPEGTDAPSSIALTPMSLTFLGRGGLWAMSPSALGLTGEIDTSGQAFYNLLDQKGLSLLQGIDRSTFTSVYDSDTQRLVFAYKDGDDYKIAEVDWPLQALTVWSDVPALCLFLAHDGKLLAGYEDYIVELRNGNYDFHDGFTYPITTEIHTPPYDPAPMQPKRFAFVYVTFQSDETVPELQCDIIIDGELVKSIDLGEHTEQRNPYYNWGEHVTARIPVNAPGHGIQLRLKCDKPVVLYSWAFEWSTLVRKGAQV